LIRAAYVARLLGKDTPTVRSIQHDAAYAMAVEVVALVACLRDEERRELFEQAYSAIKQGLEKYEEKAARRRLRLGPSQN
jgi:hypothetical protein